MNIPKVYEPQKYEPTTYALWEASGVFSPTGKGEPYGVVMPPPNANGNLHVGHALSFDLEDILVRYHRMNGKDAVLIPGSDHAGFETWVVYEKELAKQGKTRFDFSRNELYQQVWDFVEARRGDMSLQLRALGIGAAWEHSVFTLDEKVVDTVYDAFHRLWDEGLIYRGERIVNYCTKHQTSFADIEVVYKELSGKLWHIAYPLLDKVGEVVVATTRPETMLGDTAIAVHPEDERYKDLIGMMVQVPIVHREIPIVGDDTVDMQFGTGAVKITPAHDPLDFEIGQRHNLPTIEAITQEGKISQEASPQFAGQDIETARSNILNTLETEELLRSTEEYSHNVGHCYKCGTIIQPLIKDQWFVRMEPLAKPAIEAIKKKKVKYVPESKGRVTIQYLEKLKDWNISRQIAWGIPIPAFQNVADHTDWIFDTRVDQETIQVNGKTYRRDDDTFDTWFSSTQWPYIVTDYLKKAGSDASSASLSRFYPNSVMETGHDLLDRWVARMIMMGLYRTGKVPFEDVYMHGMVLDERGQKMSKSKGNVLNPMEVIAEYGSDALRLGIVMNRTAGQNQAFSPATVIAGRNFCNKLWNISRYAEDHLVDFGHAKPKPESIADHWVLRQVHEGRKQIDALMKDYRFAEAAELVYHLVWDDVADWYLEASKLQPNASVLTWVMETILKLAHPFAPFVTETIWSTVEGDRDLLAASQWPKKPEYSTMAAEHFTKLQELVVETRFVATSLPGGKQRLLYENDSLIADNEALVAHLARLASVTRISAPQGLRLAVPNREAWLDVTSDVLYEHQAHLEQRLAECKVRIDQLQGRLANDSYVKNAPAKVVQDTRDELEQQLEQQQRLSRELHVIE